MLLEIKKQVSETQTVDIKTPSYYKDAHSFYHINENGTLINVASGMISVWEPQKLYHSEYAHKAIAGKEITKEEFDNAYSATLARLNQAVFGKVEI